MVKSAKNDNVKPAKLHLEIPRANWDRVESYLKAYNEDAGRMTPKIKLAHVVNLALAQFLSRRGA